VIALEKLEKNLDIKEIIEKKEESNDLDELDE
jgi:hypothetical protein